MKLQHDADIEEKIKNVLAANEKNTTMVYDGLKKRQEDLAGLERYRKLRLIPITTDDNEVKLLLRERGLEITLFGENPADRRFRLRESITELGPIKTKRDRELEKQEADELIKTTWYHEGSMELKEARVKIANYALKTQERLNQQREHLALPKSEKTSQLQRTHRYIQECSSIGSQVGHERPISCCQISPNNKMLATASFSGVCKLWSIPQCKEVTSFRDHTINVGSIVFHPESTLSLDESAANLASCAHDGSVKLWNLKSSRPVGSLDGHEKKVSRVAYHPSGNYLGTACHDASWRLWDLETQVELLHQEGHTKGVHDISFQCDGSIALTGGLDAYGRVWDLRTGRCIFFLEGHLKEIFSVCFSPNGYQMATGGADNTVKIWDMRTVSCSYTIPAHEKLISKLQYEKSRGNYLITGSYDGSAKVWSTPGYLPLNTFKGHQGKVMGLDVANDGQTIVTCSSDRTYKLWANDMEGL